VNEEGLHRTSSSRIGDVTPIVAGPRGFAKDSSMGVDRLRVAHDGWVSVIGQSGQTVAVVDYWLGGTSK
jgi:hypothetical protein